MDRDDICLVGAVLGLLLMTLGAAWNVSGGGLMSNGAMLAGIVMAAPSLKGGQDSPLIKGIRESRLFRLTLGFAGLAFGMVMAWAVFRLIAEP